MSQNDQICPFDWKDGANGRLKGGRLLRVTDHRFAYGFYPNGEFLRAVVTSTLHNGTVLEVMTGYPEELAELDAVILRELKGGAYNISINVGPAAGETVFEHPHIHYIRRFPGQLASGKGQSALITEVNELTYAAREFKRTPWDGT